jgi:hypothetical protein
MVSSALKYLSGIVVAKIKEGNAASESIALSAGFKKADTEEGLTLWTIDLAARMQGRAK